MQAEAAGQQQSVRVSILDDQALIRDSLSRALQSAGIPVVGQYGDPSQFLSGLERDHPAVAIVEMLHNGQEEISVLREAHQFHPDIPLLVLSSNTEPAAVQRCFDAGATGYLDKFSTGCDSVVHAVRAVARGDRVFPPDILGSLLHASAQTDPGAAKLAVLSARERQVLTYLSAGADNLKISICLKISERTVKAHVSSLYRKLGQENRTQLALLARQLGVRPAADA